jgi:hypothetical protein
MSPWLKTTSRLASESRSSAKSASPLGGWLAGLIGVQPGPIDAFIPRRVITAADAVMVGALSRRELPAMDEHAAFRPGAQ